MADIIEGMLSGGDHPVHVCFDCIFPGIPHGCHPDRLRMFMGVSPPPLGFGSSGNNKHGERTGRLWPVSIPTLQRFICSENTIDLSW